jgi:hypothetical protein
VSQNLALRNLIDEAKAYGADTLDDNEGIRFNTPHKICAKTISERSSSRRAHIEENALGWTDIKLEIGPLARYVASRNCTGAKPPKAECNLRAS